jgi:hypothetical protein
MRAVTAADEQTSNARSHGLQRTGDSADPDAKSSPIHQRNSATFGRDSHYAGSSDPASSPDTQRRERPTVAGVDSSGRLSAGAGGRKRRWSASDDAADSDKELDDVVDDDNNDERRAPPRLAQPNGKQQRKAAVADAAAATGTGTPVCCRETVAGENHIHREAGQLDYCNIAHNNNNKDGGALTATAKTK